MDAKPQRLRGVRVHDENLVPSNMMSHGNGKSLGHIRTKSTPALSTLLQGGTLKPNFRVLGEINANLRVAPKDDSEVGRVSPGKLKSQKEAQIAPLARTAVRPLAAKNGSGQAVPLSGLATTQSKASAADNQNTTHVSEQTKKVVAKRSTRVLRDVRTETDAPSQKASTLHPGAQIFTTQSQELHSASNLPSRDAAVAASRNVDASGPIATTSKMPPAGDAVPQAGCLGSLPHNVPHAVVQLHTAAAQPAVPYEDDEGIELNDDDYTTGRDFGLDLTGGHTMVLNPLHTERIQAEIENAKAFVMATRPVEDVEDEHWDTSMVAEYGDEIFSYMRELEVRMAPNPVYMDQQTEIQWSMRAVLVDWVVQVHQRFNLLPETLFLTINYIDRFLSCKIVSLGKLQLVGATAIFIAAKYEEVNCPTLSEIIYMVDNGYTADELLKAERFMLSMLQFELGWPGPMSFLRRISKADDYDLETRTLAKYFLEVTIMDERFVGCTPSYLAAGAHCMARLLLRKGDWSPAHVYYSNYTMSQLHRLLQALLDCCQTAKVHHRTVYEKYTDRRYKKSSLFVREQIQGGFQLSKMSHYNVIPAGHGGEAMWA